MIDGDFGGEFGVSVLGKHLRDAAQQYRQVAESGYA
jgi:hypothetical protein